MNFKTTFSSIFLLLVLSVFPFRKAFACHGTVLTNLTFSLSATDLTIDANSDPATCGCGPYFMEVELIPSTSSFSGNPPVWTSSSWGTAPWFHSILNVPGYSAPNWADNCVLEPYTTLVIPFSGLCPGVQYQWRIRENPTGSLSVGPWSSVYTFTTPGTPVSPTLNATASPAIICIGNSSFLDAFGGGCSGPGTFNWSPIASLSSPSTSSTLATPTVTTTYTITFFDALLSQTFVDSVTVYVSSTLAATGSSIEAGCNAFNGSALTNVTGGSPPYTYLWTQTNDTTSYISPVGNSAYDVTITDAAGCNVQLQILVGDSCDPVWPGDVNDDSIADNFDFLDLALAYGGTGTTRNNTSIAWNGLPSAYWGQTIPSGTDYKFADCNGNGIIDMNDTTAILLNYGLYHTYRYGAPVYNTALPDLQIHFLQDSVASGGYSGTAQLILGSATQPADSIYGLAFTVNYNPVEIDVTQTRLSATNSWLGTPGSDLFGAAHSDASGQLGIAIARIDHTNRSGNGMIGSIHFSTTSNLSGTGNSVLVPFTITNVKVISANDSLLAVNTVPDTVTVYDELFLGITGTGEIHNLQIFPNPSDGIFSVNFSPAAATDYSIEILNSLGQVVYSEKGIHANGNVQKKIDLSGEASGLFLVKISGDNSEVVQKIFTR
jgi:hypothetical protein